MEILKKIIDCKNSQGNFYGGVSFSRVTSLQFSGCNFAIERILHKFFLGNAPKTGCLKKIKKVFFLEKSLQWTSVLIKLQSCSTKP